MQPDVTFLVAAFDAAGTIAQAIGSALGQTGVSVEVVVVDDASTDGTAAVVANLDDPRVTLVRLPRNLGPGGARNAGLAAAKGRFVAVLDADDTVHSNRMSRLVARLDASGAAAIVDGLEVRTADGAIAPMFAKNELTHAPDLSFRDFVLGNRLFAGTFNYGYLKPVFRRQFLVDRAIRYPEDIRIGEDYQFLADVLFQGGRCLMEPAVGYTYRITEGSVSRVLTLKHIEGIARSDRAFLRDRVLEGDAREAYRLRSRSIERARSFVTMVEALQRRDVATAVRAGLRDPYAVTYFKMPIAKRLAGLSNLLRRVRTERPAAPQRSRVGGE